LSGRLSYAGSPSIGASYLKALFDRRPRRLPPGDSSPVIEAEVGAVQAEPARLAAYREVCELRDDGQLPLTYPHVLAAGVHMAMLLHPAFPIRMAGLVHLGHEIELHAPLPESAPLALDCRLEPGRRKARGDEFRMITEALRDGALAWRETMSFLVPAPGDGRKRAPEPPALPPCVGEWTVPVDTGRRYARVSGDWNPIHLADFLARPFGFPAAIAHGMWTLARCLGWLAQVPVQPGARLSARFMKPLLLPGAVGLHADLPAEGRARNFWLVSEADGTPYLRGCWTQ
jgi:hypothetical protein